ncbi:DUF2510 domain-containing protein [Rhodococcus sp. BP22]|uniref:DUF2510 domain-containing protein n=1 Tax=Rhodococcus sp. BP22 TaxID=2758566 RepID=UPI0021BDE77E|nr:DUF2510 domain-containing protein [Rhodococcus sp. BP22]
MVPPEEIAGQGVSPPPPHTPPPGWHPDPSEPGLLRYWDGTQWTEHTQSAAEPTAAGPTAAENIPADPAEVAATDEPGRTGVPSAVKIVGASSPRSLCSG